MGRLKRFLSPQVAKLILSSGDDKLLDSHRRDITVVFCDLRGFTAFAETRGAGRGDGGAARISRVLGAIIHKFEGTLEHFAGDGVHGHLQRSAAVPGSGVARGAHGGRDARTGRGAGGEMAQAGHELGFGIGIAHGYATLGRIGFEGRIRLFGDRHGGQSRLAPVREADDGQILIDGRVQLAVEAIASTEPIGDLDLKGFHRPVRAFNVRELTA